MSDGGVPGRSVMPRLIVVVLLQGQAIHQHQKSLRIPEACRCGGAQGIRPRFERPEHAITSIR